MKKNLCVRIISAILTGVMLIPMISACSGNEPKTSTSANGDITTAVTTTVAPTTTTAPDADVTPVANNLIWPEGQIFPTFPEGDGTLEVVMPSIITFEEQIALHCMQGIVNANGIRFAIYYDNVKKWAETYGYKANLLKTAKERYAAVQKYSSEFSGVVLYSSKQYTTCNDYLNLATTVASINNAIPVSDTVYKRWQRNGVELNVVEDLTTLTLNTKLEIYQYLYDNYWKDATKRLLIVQSPTMHEMRDYATAAGAAVVHLSCSASNMLEKKLFEKFCKDMTPGESILMGWNGEERELMTTIAAHGLSCVPADFFTGASIFAVDGLDVKINEVPDMPALENKIYIAFYFSDGDNIQYDMNALREYWDNAKSYRGRIPLNWTISPALLEVAPGMLNYYYGQASENDCFVCGPSGLGYTFPMNTFGPNVGNNFKDKADFTSFVQMTNKYLAKTGLRTVTIWDNLSADQRDIYTKYGSYLYGLTVHNFTNGSLSIKYTKTANDKLVQQLTPGYFAKNAEGTTKLTEMGDIDAAVQYLRYNGKSPVFISCQVSVWAFHEVGEVIQFEKYLSDKYKKIYGSDVVEFLRADHYYNLYYKANGMPYDLTLESTVSATASSGSDSAKNLLDGTPDTVWEASEKGEQYVTVDLAAEFDLNRLMIYLASMEGDKYTLKDNAKAFKVEMSSDGKTFTEISSVTDNKDEFLEIKFEGASGRYLRITITDPGESGIARIADLDIFATAKK